MADASSLFGVSFHSPDTLLSHSRFAAARTAFLDATLALYEGNAALNRLVVEASRQIVFNMIVSTYFQQDDGDRATWCTKKLLKSKMMAFGLLSERRIDRLVGLLIRSGFLELRPASDDRRMSLLTPSAKMLALDQDWLIINYAPLHAMFPKGGYVRFLERDPALQRAQRLTSLDFVAQGAQVMDRHPTIMRFLNRDAGSMILFKLLTLTARPDGPMPSYTEIGALFGVSRTHVRSVLEEAAAHGDVALHGPGGRYVELRPSLLEAFDLFLADIMSGNDLLFRLALTRLEAR